jgi:hypothetical protein
MTEVNKLSFQWDDNEALSPDGFLTPVYFNPQVLVRYFYDSRFLCEFASETYGTISGPDFNIPFGINSSGTVIAWLGDLMQNLPKREKFYWLVENKEPEGDIESEFNLAQLEAQFTEPPEALQCLDAIERLNNNFFEHYGFHLYKPQPFELRFEAVRRYKRVILNNEDDFKRFISELNEIINENTNNAGIRDYLQRSAVDVPGGVKGNKLLQAVYVNVLRDSQNLVAPFFYLYDLRLWSDHTGMEDKYCEVVLKLGLVEGSTHSEVMSSLLQKLIESSHRLEALISN